MSNGPITDAPPMVGPRSEAQAALVRRAHDLIPGGTTNSIVPPAGMEFVVDRGEGVHLYDVDGRRFLDFLTGGGPLILGHAHPRLVEALQRSVLRGTHHFELHHRTIELAERVVSYVPCAEAIRFTSSGSEATFHAMRLARAATGRKGILKLDGGYHGHHDLATWSFEHGPDGRSLHHAESAGIQDGVAGDVSVVPYNDAEALEQALASRPGYYAAVIMEPAQRALKPLPGYLERVREACDLDGSVLIFDEVVTGFRFGPGGAQGRYGVTPDLTCLGKALSGGLPLSAVVGRRDLMAHMAPGDDPATYSFHCGTFNGYLHAVEAAHTTLDIVVEEEGWKRLDALGDQVRELLRKVYADAGVPAFVSGDGALFHSYFTEEEVHDAAALRRSDIPFSNEMHLLLRRAGIYKSFVKGYVCLAHEEAHLEEFAAATAWAVRTLKGS